MPPPGLIPAIALRTIIAGGCLFGIWNSLKVARADLLFRQDTADSVRSAISLTPDNSSYFMRLAQLDENRGRELLETALRLNQYNAQASVELGLRYEAEGDYSRAEKFLLHASAVDHTYGPRWSLANFYLRRDDIPAFWVWARRASEMPADDIGALFELCWRVSPNPEQIAVNILNDNPEPLRQFLRFLLAKDQVSAAARVAPRLLRNGRPEIDRPQMFSLVNSLVSAGDATAAKALWQDLVQQHWVVGDTTTPNNADFARAPVPISFDWDLPSYPGLHSWPGPSGLETEFTGLQPESCFIAEQILALVPGRYTMKYSYRTTDIPPETGIRWQIVDAKSGAVIASSPNLSSDALAHAAMDFTVGQDASLLRLRLAYERALGTRRISGTLVMLSTEIEPHPAI